jgi:hypothetical protein
MPKPVYLIAGPARHGKTTVSQYIAEKTAGARASTSDPLFELMAAERGVTVEQLRTMPKEEIRPRLIALGEEFCRDNKAAIIIHLSNKGARIIDGLRSRAELRRVRIHFDTLGETMVTVWVHDPRKPMLNDVGDLQPGDLDVVLRNDGTIPDLQGNIDKQVLQLR